MIKNAMTSKKLGWISLSVLLGSSVWAAEPAYRCRLQVEAQTTDPADNLTETVAVSFTASSPFAGPERSVTDLSGSLTFNRPQQDPVTLPLQGEGTRGNGVILLTMSGGKIRVFFDERERKVFLYRHHTTNFNVLQAQAACEEPAGRVINYVLDNKRTDGTPLSVRIQVCYAGVGFCTEANETVSQGGVVAKATGGRVADILKVDVRYPGGGYSPCLIKQLFPLMRGASAGYLLNVAATGDDSSPVFDCRLRAF